MYGKVLDVKLKNISENFDFSEFCITSKANVSYLENSEIIVQTSKAKGTKCPICWKINEEPCARTNCSKKIA